MLALPIAKHAAIHARVIVDSRRNAEVSGLDNPFHVCQFPSRNLYPRGISIWLAPGPSATPALRLMQSEEFNAVANCVGREILDPRDFDGVGGELPHTRRDVQGFFEVEARGA